MKHTHPVRRTFPTVLLSIVVMLLAGGWYVRSTTSEDTAQTDGIVALSQEENYPTFLPYKSESIEHLPISVPNGTIDPVQHEPLQATGFHNEYIPPQNRLYMVQYKATPSAEMYMSVRPARVFDTNTYILSATSEELRELTKSTNVNFVEQYHPHYKLDPAVVEAFYNQAITPKTVFEMTVSAFAPKSAVETLFADATANGVSERGVQYLVDGLIDRGQLFIYALNPLITEIRLKQ